jgi:hypothetical protein
MTSFQRKQVTLKTKNILDPNVLLGFGKHFANQLQMSSFGEIGRKLAWDPASM